MNSSPKHPYDISPPVSASTRLSFFRRVLCPAQATDCQSVFPPQGWKLVGLKMVTPGRQLVGCHYEEHADKVGGVVTIVLDLLTLFQNRRQSFEEARGRQEVFACALNRALKLRVRPDTIQPASCSLAHNLRGHESENSFQFHTPGFLLRALLRSCTSCPSTTSHLVACFCPFFLGLPALTCRTFLRSCWTTCALARSWPWFGRGTTSSPGDAR